LDLAKTEDISNVRRVAAPQIPSSPNNSPSPHPGGALPPTPEPQLAFSGTVDGKWGRGDVRATGMYAGAVLAGVASASIMLWADPFHNPQHFVVAMFVSMICGMFVSGGVSHGRITDALEARDAFRIEMNRIAWRNQELERIILKHRLSSASETPPPPPATTANPSLQETPPFREKSRKNKEKKAEALKS